MASSLDPKYITQGPNKGKWTIAFAASEGPSKYNKGGSFWFESEEAALKALEQYKAGTPKALRAKLKKLLANRTQITTGELTDIIQKLWGNTRAAASNLLYKIRKNFPEVLVNKKGIALTPTLTGGISEAFTTFLEEKLKPYNSEKPLRTTATKLVEESKVKIKEGTARNIIDTKFPNKVSYTGYEIDVSKAIEAYKKLPEQTKIDFQTGGPGQKGKYKKWLASQGLTQPTATQLFRKKLEEQGLYKKAPYKGDKLAKERYIKRKTGLKKVSSRPYEEALTTLKRDLTDELGIKKVKQPGGGFRTPLDLAHRLSYEQIGKLGSQLTPENLGIDAFKINREVMKSIENSLTPLYEEQVKLFNKAKKLDKIPFDLKKQIDANNNAIAEVIAEKANGRLQGVQVNYNNLKIETTPIDYSQTLGQGMVNKPISKIKPGSMDDIIVKLNLIEQMKKEYKNLPIEGQRKWDQAINCADGCFVKELNNNPEGTLQKFTRGIKNFFVPKPEMPSIKYDDTLGAFVKSGTDNVVSQGELKTWATDNPMPVQAGTAKPGILRKTGRALAHLGLPLPTAAMDTYFIGKQIEEGRDPAEIAKDPFNWLGLATMEPLTKAAGMADKSGKMASVMRLGMSPGMIRGATRFLGLPGLALSTGLTAYDQYKKYQNKEGFIYDLFNKEEIDNTSV